MMFALLTGFMAAYAQQSGGDYFEGLSRKIGFEPDDSGVAAMFGMNALPVMAAEDVSEKVTVGEDVDAGVGADAGISDSDSNSTDVDTGSQTAENVAIDNPDGDVLAGSITDSKPQTLPPAGEIIAAAGLGGIALALAVYDIRN